MKLPGDGIMSYEWTTKNLLLYTIQAASPLASRGFAPIGDQKFFLLKFVKGPRKSSAKKNWGDFFVLGGVGGVPPPTK